MLLNVVFQKITSAGYRFENADITIIAEAPFLAPYIEKMRETLSKALSAPVDAVSIKASTTEGLGFTGRGEGIGAMAIALVSRQEVS